MNIRRIRSIWTDMRRRCENPSRPDFKWYGERGISVCEEWRNSFVAFKEWAIQNGYDDSLTLDRRDVNYNYHPENCRWATIKQQERNRRNNDVLEYDGQKCCLAEWAERLGITQAALWNRIYKYRWPLERALSSPRVLQ